MNYSVRRYDSKNDDFQNISDFMLEHAGYISENTPWTYQRLIDWKYGRYENRLNIEGFWDRSLLMFLMDDAIIGLAVNEDGDEVIAIITAPEYRHLFGEFLSVANQQLLHIGENIVVELSENQDIEQSYLIDNGYKEIGRFCTHIYDLKDYHHSCSVPDQYEIVSMAEMADYAGQTQLRSMAFGGKTLSDESMMAERMSMVETLLKAPTYNAETDLVIKDSEGQIVAGCEPLINFMNKDAEIERVCTLDTHRGQGLARAVISEAMHRLKEKGIEKAYITGFTDETKHLYSSFGPHQKVQMYTFSKPKS